MKRLGGGDLMVGKVRVVVKVVIWRKDREGFVR